MKHLLFIAPLPPPVTGQSLASQTLYDGLKSSYEITLHNYSRSDALSARHGFFDSVRRILDTVRAIVSLKKNPQRVYFTITQSRPGNLRDLLILFILGHRVRRETVIHLHGGFFHELYSRMPGWQQSLNRWLYGELKAGIVLGESLIPCLLPVMPVEKIRVVPNFFPPENLISDSQLRDKWRDLSKIKILFLSNFLIEKGYRELIEGYVALEPMIRSRFELHLAGGFPDEDSEMTLLKQIDGQPDIHYHGTVLGPDKKDLLISSHLFFLPTYYPVEGQPISILEAYASGLCVFTTRQGGIPDIFSEPANGRLVQQKSASDIALRLIDVYKDPESVRKTGYYNRDFSLRFKRETWIQRIQSILEEV